MCVQNMSIPVGNLSPEERAEFVPLRLDGVAFLQTHVFL